MHFFVIYFVRGYLPSANVYYQEGWHGLCRLSTSLVCMWQHFLCSSLSTLKCIDGLQADSFSLDWLMTAKKICPALATLLTAWPYLVRLALSAKWYRTHWQEPSNGATSGPWLAWLKQFSSSWKPAICFGYIPNREGVKLSPRFEPRCPWQNFVTLEGSRLAVTGLMDIRVSLYLLESNIAQCWPQRDCGVMINRFYLVLAKGRGSIVRLTDGRRMRVRTCTLSDFVRGTGSNPLLLFYEVAGSMLMTDTIWCRRHCYAVAAARWYGGCRQMSSRRCHCDNGKLQDTAGRKCIPQWRSALAPIESPGMSSNLCKGWDALDIHFFDNSMLWAAISGQSLVPQGFPARKRVNANVRIRDIERVVLRSKTPKRGESGMSRRLQMLGLRLPLATDQPKERHAIRIHGHSSYPLQKFSSIYRVHTDRSCWVFNLRVWGRNVSWLYTTKNWNYQLWHCCRYQILIIYPCCASI